MQDFGTSSKFRSDQLKCCAGLSSWAAVGHTLVPPGAAVGHTSVLSWSYSVTHLFLPRATVWHSTAFSWSYIGNTSALSTWSYTVTNSALWLLPTGFSSLVYIIDPCSIHSYCLVASVLTKLLNLIIYQLKFGGGMFILCNLKWLEFSWAEWYKPRT